MRTSFEEISPPSGGSLPPLIFLHGMLVSRKLWKIVAPLIARKTGRKAYLLDARNHGQSAWSDEMNFDLLVNDLVEFMDTRNIERAVIVGNSMGGRTAINFALKYPNKVDALVVEDMTPRNVTSGSHTFVQMAVDLILDRISAYPPEIGLEEAKQRFIDDILLVTSSVYTDKEKLLRYVDADIVPLAKTGDDTFRLDSNVDVVLAMLKSGGFVQDLPQKNLVFNGDALFIHGSKGFFDLGNDRTVKKMFPKAVVRKIEGASHIAHLDSPEEYADIVSEFILSRNGSHLSKY